MAQQLKVFVSWRHFLVPGDRLAGPELPQEPQILEFGLQDLSLVFDSFGGGEGVSYFPPLCWVPFEGGGQGGAWLSALPPPSLKVKEIWKFVRGVWEVFEFDLVISFTYFWKLNLGGGSRGRGLFDSALFL